MSMTTGNVSLLTRAEVWSGELKEILRDEMMAQRYVRMLEGFPDGDTFKIPSIGQAQVDNYAEDTAVQYRPLDTGQFTFSVDKYLSSATYITKKAKQDMFYMNEMVSRFVPEQERAIMAHFETTAIAAPEAGVSANSNETIDGVEHRYAAGGTGAVVTLEDFARARHVLKKSNVPATAAAVSAKAPRGFLSKGRIIVKPNSPIVAGIIFSAKSPSAPPANCVAIVRPNRALVNPPATLPAFPPAIID